MPTPIETFDQGALAGEMEALLKTQNQPETPPEGPLGDPVGETGPQGVEGSETQSEPANEPAAEPAAPAAEEEEASLEDALQKTIADKAKPKEEPKVEPAAVEKPKVEVPERDKDLVVPEEAKAHQHPRTRKLIEERNQKITAARDERDRILSEKTALEEKLRQAEEAAKVVRLPKETEDELSTLRERVRELDISRDPQLEAKYDKVIAKNNTGIIEVLKKYGADTTTVDGKQVPAPENIVALQKMGLNLKTLKPMIDKLDEIGETDAAESLREYVRENSRLTRAKGEEIDNWKANYQAKVESRTVEQQKNVEGHKARVREVAQQTHDAEVAELAKTFPYLVKPVADPKDTPQIAAAKQKATAEYEAAEALILKSASTFDATPDGQGRLSAAAVKGLRLTHVVLPRVTRELAARDARIKELEAQVAGTRKASTLSKAHSAAASTASESAKPLPTDFADAMRQIAGERGINVNS